MSVNVGDTMRISVALLKQMYDAPDHLSLLVTLREIREEADGSKTLVVDAAMQPCECGCGRIVQGGMVEVAHPEDYRYDERA